VRLAILSPAPLGQADTPEAEDEVLGMVAALRNSGAKSEVEVIVPASVLRIPGTGADIVHIAAHADNHHLLLEDFAGLAIPTDSDALVEALSPDWPALVVLNGCDTERLGRRLHAASSGSWIIGHQGYLGNASASAFAGDFSHRLASGAQIGAAFDLAAKGAAARFGDLGYVLFPGRRKLPARADGSCVVTGMAAYQSRLRHARTLGSFHEVLLSAAGYCLGNTPGAFNVHGVPGSGVSTLLHAISGRMAFAFGEVVQASGAEASPVIDAAAAGSRRVLLCVDDADPLFSGGPDAPGALGRLCRSGQVRVVLGTSLRLDHPLVSVTAQVPSLSEQDARQLLDGQIAADQVSAVIGMLFDHEPVYAGTVAGAAAQVRANVPLATMRRWLESGQDDERWVRLVEGWQSDPPLRLLLRAAAFSGSPVRMSALEHAFTLASPDSLPAGRAAESAFGEAYDLLVRHGVMGELQPGVAGTTFAVSTPELRRAAAHVWRRPSAAETTELLTGLVRSAGDLHAERRLVPRFDARWVAAVLGAAAGHGLDAMVTEVGGALIDRASDFRRSADRDCVHQLATAVLKAAEHEKNWTVAAQAALVSGEACYGSGELSAAAEYFAKCLRFPVPEGQDFAGDRLRAHRALGQVHYRRGDFLGALAEYESAEKYESDSPPSFAATLRHHHAKALFRLGRLAEAEAKLTLVLAFREAGNDLHALAKAQHELGRVLIAADRVAEAKDLFNRALLSAVAGNFARFLPAPLYELFLISFHDGDPDAGTLASRCSAAAEDSDDELWLALSAVARGMMAFRAGEYREAGELFRRAMSKAELNDFEVVRDDIRRFVAHSVHDPAYSEGSAPPEGATALVAATWGLTEEKARKALQYVREPARIQSAEVVFRSRSAVRNLRWVAHRWSCDCELYLAKGICTHAVALSLARTNPFGVVSDPRASGA